jgi:hypothetical protein
MALAHPRSTLRRLTYKESFIVLTGSGSHAAFPVPANGVIDNIAFQQATPGTTGTSWTTALAASLRKRLGAADVQLFTTAPVVTLAAGAGAAVETNKRKDAIATPAGCTKPVMAAGAIRVKKGDILYFNVSTTGAYAPFPVVSIMVQLLLTP